MLPRFSLRLAERAVTTLLVLAVLVAWRADRRDRTQLAAELASAKQALAQADARQHERDAQLVQTLAALAAEKRNVTTPSQIVRDLPQQIPLPEPITLQFPSDAPNASRNLAPVADKQTAQASSSTAKDTPVQATLPTADLKPLYDFAIDCKACQAKLTAAQRDLADEQAKATILTKERDAAVRTAKGGSALRRMARAAKWLAIGVAFGAVASQAMHR